MGVFDRKETDIHALGLLMAGIKSEAHPGGDDKNIPGCEDRE
jgi:hypothetical protein